MSNEKQFANITVRVDREFLERLVQVEAATGFGRSEITRQSLDAAVRAFESTGELRFPLAMVTAGVPEFTREVLNEAVERHLREKEKGEFYDRHAQKVHNLFTYPTAQFLKQLDDYIQSSEFVPEDDDLYDASEISITHQGVRLHPHNCPVEQAVEAGAPIPPNFRYDLALLLKDVITPCEGPARVMRVFGRGMHPLIPFGANILVQDWPYIDLPSEGMVVIYKWTAYLGETRLRIGELKKRKAGTGEKSDSGGEVTVARMLHDAFPQEDIILPGQVVGTFIKVINYPVAVDLPTSPIA
jgi:hypothetical protein